ncbi:hypothetical protein EBX31_13535 [bacterium]|nr:hypothetical protein [bacterium]
MDHQAIRGAPWQLPASERPGSARPLGAVWHPPAPAGSPPGAPTPPVPTTRRSRTCCPNPASHRTGPASGK